MCKEIEVTLELTEGSDVIGKYLLTGMTRFIENGDEYYRFRASDQYYVLHRINDRLLVVQDTRDERYRVTMVTIQQLIAEGYRVAPSDITSDWWFDMDKLVNAIDKIIEHGGAIFCYG